MTLVAYRKNVYRKDLIQRFGQETGLPLFEKENKEIPKHVQKRIETVPKAIYEATETRKIADMTEKVDQLSLADKQQQVLGTMYERNDWSYQELAEKLGWSVNRVIPRVYELRQLGLVVPAEKRQCLVTGYVIQSWRVK
jgi:predicted transcriptional regulator